MSGTFVGQIIMFGGPYAPKNFAFCNGQQLSIQQNSALFALLGTTYGGDGRTTFNLPDLRGRAPLHSGGGSQGPGLTAYPLGTSTGTENVTLDGTQLPAHSHFANALTAVGNAPSPSGTIWAEGPNPGGRGGTSPNLYAATSNARMSGSALAPMGGNQPHANVQPSIAINYIIALVGVYPPRP